MDWSTYSKGLLASFHLFACIYFFLLLLGIDELDCVLADIDFDIDEVLKTLPALDSNEGFVLVDGKLLSTFFFGIFIHLCQLFSSMEFILEEIIASMPELGHRAMRTYPSVSLKMKKTADRRASCRK